jgi:hypothetical protein
MSASGRTFSNKTEASTTETIQFLKDRVARKQLHAKIIAQVLYEAQIRRSHRVPELQASLERARKAAVRASNALIEFETRCGVYSDSCVNTPTEDCGNTPTELETDVNKGPL